MEPSKLYPWEETYVAAILETDDAQLAGRILAADAKIQARLEELNLDHGGTPAEREALSAALRGLDLLKKERVGDASGNRL